MSGRVPKPVDHLVVRRLTDELTIEPEETLRELARALPAHFRYEEKEGGFFERMIELGRDVQVVERLKEDHQDILAEIARLVDAPRDESWTERIEYLARHLRRHEFEESRFAADNPILSGDHDVFRKWGV